jgi:hypothetical protein
MDTRNGVPRCGDRCVRHALDDFRTELFRLSGVPVPPLPRVADVVDLRLRFDLSLSSTFGCVRKYSVPSQYVNKRNSPSQR